MFGMNAKSDTNRNNEDFVREQGVIITFRESGGNEDAEGKEQNFYLYIFYFWSDTRTLCDEGI